MFAEVALCCLMDVSNSMDDDEYRLQMQGTAEAFTHNDVIRAISSRDGVAFCLIQWADIPMTVIPWVVLRTENDCQRLSRQIDGTPRADRMRIGLYTGVGRALAAAVEAFQAITADRMVVDISLDGVDNMSVLGNPREDLIDMGVQINALPIFDSPGRHGAEEANERLLAYVRRSVVSPGGIVVQAEDFSDFGRAMVRKLNSEIS